MEIIKESNVIPYSSEKLYSHIIDIDNYEQILKDEIRSFDKLSDNEFKIKIIEIIANFVARFSFTSYELLLYRSL